MSDAILQQILTELKALKTDVGEIHTIKNDLNIMKEELQLVKEEVQTVKGDLQLVKEEVQMVKEDLQLVKSQLDENTQLTKAIHHRQEETDAKLENLTKEVDLLRDEFTSLKKGQARQDKILATLAMKSLEQETDLRELKQAN